MHISILDLLSFLVFWDKIKIRRQELYCDDEKEEKAAAIIKDEEKVSEAESLWSVLLKNRHQMIMAVPSSRTFPGNVWVHVTKGMEWKCSRFLERRMLSSVSCVPEVHVFFGKRRDVLYEEILRIFIHFLIHWDNTRLSLSHWLEKFPFLSRKCFSLHWIFLDTFHAFLSAFLSRIHGWKRCMFLAFPLLWWWWSW